VKKFLARQPIFDKSQNVFAYELLFRSGIENSCGEINHEAASTSMADTSFLFGLQKLTEGRLAFVNCPRQFLLSDYISLFPRDFAVVELLENVTPDDEVIAACRRLKQKGYLLALDDFTGSPVWNPVIPFADFIKVDFRLTSHEQQRSLALRLGARGIRMLAEKVETREEAAEAVKMGYALFQGFYFCRPQMLAHEDVPPFRLAYLKLLQAANEPEYDVGALAKRIKQEPSLTYRLLRYLNSAGFGLRMEVRSIRHALALLGEQELRKWISVVAVAVMADGQPHELLTLPLVRGRFCELLAHLTGLKEHSNDLFLMGLLSVMDAILHLPMDAILAEVPVRSEVKQALLGQAGIYRDILDIATAQERADWERLSGLALHLRLPEATIANEYLAAVDWAAGLRRDVHASAAK
jgi:c-di-GMP-related signal transduction protein